ncbi:calpain-9 [Anabrus simplex]|uniref:calpain-9 n=1 Tax=Anabrus simplex TaxID=316456 RepID=UPI0035A3C823
MPVRTDVQAAKLKKILASVKGSDLYCDPDFPATNDSLFQDPENELPLLVWKRPHEIVSKPQMFVDGANRTDVKQGALGDCWFLSAASAIACRPELIQKVVPEGQVLYGEGYKGLVTFRFWRMGTWVTINIDDRLPVDEDNDLYYGRCQDPNEFWLPLMEKAFAKFHGNYNNMNGGQLAESFTSLTGYITESAGIEDVPVDELFILIRQEFRNGSVITCGRGDIETAGLVTNHAYTVTGARRVELPGQAVVKLLRIRNPWGKVEWSGEWGDSDSRWKKVAESVRKEMEYHPEDDGEFWINVTDFIKVFQYITVACKIPDREYDKPVPLKTLLSLRNAWVKGRTAGGSIGDDMKKYATNPQYLLTVKETDDDDVCQPGEAPDQHAHHKHTCNVIVELVQEHNRKKFQEFYYIGFYVYPYKKPKPAKRLSAGDLKEFQPVGFAEHMPISSAVGRFDLEPGSYVIIPCTDEPDLSRDFLLRVYCHKPITFKELC